MNWLYIRLEGSTKVDTTYGTPRVGDYTHGPEIGIHFIIKT
jgi:hypothetical protein